MKQRIYIDTSVIGGYFDEEFKEATIKLFERLENNEIIFVVSDLLDLELINAPQQVRDHLLKYSPDKFQRVELTEEVIKLADTYIFERHWPARRLNEGRCGDLQPEQGFQLVDGP